MTPRPDGPWPTAPLDLPPEDFRRLGQHLVDRLADFLGTLPERPVAADCTPAEVRAAIGGDGMPEDGADPGRLLDHAGDVLTAYATFVGHPRHAAYVAGSPAPIGALADLLVAALGSHASGWGLAPGATEIEAQTVRWIAELLGYPTDCGGLMVSGGNMANFVGFWTALRAKAGWDVHAGGLVANPGGALRVYASAETHTWIHKAARLSGLGTDAIHWIPTDAEQRMDLVALREAVDADERNDYLPLMVVGAAGTVSTGAVDPLPAIAALCQERNLWFHVDGAYGGFGVIASDVPADLRGLSLADSVAVDPHKWLYTPFEAGCALVRDRRQQLATFSYRPPYYHLDDHEEELINYFEYGPQNTRGFRALKVWLGLRQAGRCGYAAMIERNIALAQELFELCQATPELEAWTRGLSITTFRYVPADLTPGEAETEEYLNGLNRELVGRLQRGGELFLSNAVVRDTYLLRTCWVNFRTSSEDIRAIPGIVRRVGTELDRELRGPGLI